MPNVLATGVTLPNSYSASLTLPSKTIAPPAPQVGTIAPITKLWKPASSAKRIEIHRITVTTVGGNGGMFSIGFILETGEPLSQTSEAIHGKDRSSVSSECIYGLANLDFYSNPPFPLIIHNRCLNWVVSGGNKDTLVWQTGLWTKPIVLRPNLGEGLNIRTDVYASQTSGAELLVTMEWTEV
ncbi:MAG TPA: hypothetical protein VI423_00855 [Paenisporosarcina sp.]|nr:hypothetical protein [Paenisporosarcina sp.]